MQDLRFPNPAALAKHLAGDLANRMRKTILKEGRVSIALSGGKTPVEFFQALAKEDLAWEKVSITLIDERWVDESSEYSNCRLLKQYLLQGNAQHAYFVGLKNKAKTPVDGYMQCENTLQEQFPVLHYAVLGMGLDGHTASWFPRSKALGAILNTDSHAHCTPVMDAPEHAERITLTWAFLAQCKHLFLHIEGMQKNLVLEQALRDGELDVNAMPVRQLLVQSIVPLTIYRTF